MLDLKFVRDQHNLVIKGLESKNSDFDMAYFLERDAQRRKLLNEVEQMKSERNAVTEEIARLKAAKKDATALMDQMKNLSQDIKDKDRLATALDEEVHALALTIPNLPHSSVPVGRHSGDNVEVSTWGNIPDFDFVPKNHQELGESLDILDLPRAAKITGAGFVLFKGAGARLERALINFMLDTHTREHGYTEVFPPFMVNTRTMTGTGQLPKMADDMYRLNDEEFYLIPTAEVPVTNIHREEILQDEDLVKAYVAYTPCFRREAGAYGKDTKGITRVHQFDKVELVRFVRPEDSYKELELLRGHAETILRKLQLPYRVLQLCTGDLSFAASKCYDLEVWSPGQQRYLEVSSCSNFEEFQARRMALKYKPKGSSKTQWVHTLNGSGLALARTFIAILENYQDKNGRVRVPDVLKPYMGSDWVE